MTMPSNAQVDTPAPHGFGPEGPEGARRNRSRLTAGQKPGWLWLACLAGSAVVAAAILAVPGFTVSGYPYGEEAICNWTTTPEPPSDKSILPVLREEQNAIFSAICAQGLAARILQNTIRIEDMATQMLDRRRARCHQSV